ncbi:MAG: insulinase family protein, partial [Candidatus Obscuribacterales bacterium]|nr:insulinase family protein [Candidatus Obscuribacterales bacterium]
MVVYRVGSRNEGVGYTGSTHFLEHMMFKGTTDRNPAKGNGIDDLLKPLGAAYNATTSYDRTNYFEVVASEHLETVLAIEADRMRNLVLTTEDRNSEMSVVRNEFERGENDPSDVMYKEMMAVAFREHPYHHPVIGWRSDVEGVPLERMKQFYDTFYHPDNATVIITGDFDPAHALSLVVKHFGVYPASPHPIPQVYTVEPRQEGERSFVIRRVGNDMPQVWLGFHVPEALHADIYPLAVAASMLGSHKKRASRLYKALVETGLAVECSASCEQMRDPGIFFLVATCAPDVDPALVEAALHKEIKGLIDRKADERELTRVKSSNRKATVLQHSDVNNQASSLCDGEAAGDWKWVVGFDDRFDAVTADDVAATVGKYLVATNCTTGKYVAVPETVAQPSAPDAAQVVEAEVDGSQTFAARVKRHVLPNGLTVLALATPGSGTVSLAGSIKAGDYFAGPDQALLAELTSYMLTKGSEGVTKTELAEQLEVMSAGMGFSSGPFSVGLRAIVVKDDAPLYMDLLGKVLRFPLFDQGELDQTRKEFMSHIRRNSSDTERVADARLSQALYEKSSVYHQKGTDALLEELAGYTREALVAFHRDQYVPKGTILAIVGDIDADNVVDMLPATISGWQGGEVKPIDVAETAIPKGLTRVDVPIAGKASVDIVTGLPVALRRTAADYYAAVIANAALGGDTLSSRLGLVVREKNGLTYGITSAFDNVAFGGAPWKITLTVNPANVEKALALVREVVDEYRSKGITDKELADEKGRAYGSFVVSLRSPVAVASVLSQYEFSGLGVAGIDQLKACFESVTVDEVNEAIQRYFDLDHAITVVAGSLKS